MVLACLMKDASFTLSTKTIRMREKPSLGRDRKAVAKVDGVDKLGTSTVRASGAGSVALALLVLVPHHQG